MAANYQTITFGLMQAVEEAPIDTLTSVGSDSYFTSLSNLISTAPNKLWNGNKVLDIPTGTTYKVFTHTGISGPLATSSDWTYAMESPEIIPVLAVSTANIVNLANTPYSAFAGSDSLVNGGIYLVAAQSAASQNGFYMSKGVSGSTCTMVRLNGYTTDLTDLPQRLQRTSAYVPYKATATDVTGTIYRMKDGNVTASDFTYYKDDFISNGSIIPTHSGTKQLSLASDYSFKVGNIRFTVSSEGNITVKNASAVNTFTVTSSNGNTLIYGAATLSDTLGVKGNATFVSDVMVGKNLTVTSDLTVYDDALIEGELNVSDVATFADNVVVKGTFTASDTIYAEKYVRTGYNHYTGVTDFDFSKGNVFYYHLSSGGTIGCVQSVGGTGVSDISLYLGGSFCVTVVNGGESPISVRLSDTIFSGITDSGAITLAANAGVSFTGMVLGIRGSSTTYGVYGVIAPAYQNLMV